MSRESTLFECITYMHFDLTSSILDNNPQLPSTFSTLHVHAYRLQSIYETNCNDGRLFRGRSLYQCTMRGDWKFHYWEIQFPATPIGLFSPNIRVLVQKCSAELYCEERGRAQDKEDPMRTGQAYTTVDSEQPKNCNKKDQHVATQKTREANTSRSVPKKRYSHNHFARTNYFVFDRRFIFYTVDDDVMAVVPQVNEASVCKIHIHMPVKEHWKSKHKPHWDVEEEREFEAANPGPGISDALRAGRPGDWTDPSA